MDAAQNCGDALYASLNDGQRVFVDAVMEELLNPDRGRNASGSCMAVTGEGGTGKSHVYLTIYYKARAMRKRVVVMASTGVAATLLPEGKTVHKTFGVEVPTYSDAKCSVQAGTKAADELCATDVFLWDEISMSSRYVFEAVNRTLQELRNAPGVPFGGAVFVVGGDWRQCLPGKFQLFSEH